jgi:hypothetical protein
MGLIAHLAQGSTELANLGREEAMGEGLTLPTSF